jgi:hypothetical protein
VQLCSRDIREFSEMMIVRALKIVFGTVGAL